MENICVNSVENNSTLCKKITHLGLSKLISMKIIWYQCWEWEKCLQPDNTVENERKQTKKPWKHVLENKKCYYISFNTLQSLTVCG